MLRFSADNLHTAERPSRDVLKHQNSRCSIRSILKNLSEMKYFDSRKTKLLALGPVSIQGLGSDFSFGRSESA